MTTGISSYLVKAVNFERLLEMVRELNVYWLILDEPPEVAS